MEFLGQVVAQENQKDNFKSVCSLSGSRFVGLSKTDYLIEFEENPKFAIKKGRKLSKSFTDIQVIHLPGKYYGVILIDRKSKHFQVLNSKQFESLLDSEKPFLTLEVVQHKGNQALKVSFVPNTYQIYDFDLKTTIDVKSKQIVESISWQQKCAAEVVQKSKSEVDKLEDMKRNAVKIVKSEALTENDLFKGLFNTEEILQRPNSNAQVKTFDFKCDIENHRFTVAFKIRNETSQELNNINVIVLDQSNFQVESIKSLDLDTFVASKLKKALVSEGFGLNDRDEENNLPSSQEKVFIIHGQTSKPWIDLHLQYGPKNMYFKLPRVKFEDSDTMQLKEKLLCKIVMHRNRVSLKISSIIGEPFILSNVLRTFSK